jgi:hypothetical protein
VKFPTAGMSKFNADLAMNALVGFRDCSSGAARRE